MGTFVLDIIKRWANIKTSLFPRTDHPLIPILCVKDLYSSTTISQYKSECYNKNNNYWLSVITKRNSWIVVCIMYVLYCSY